jgi:hypothetical protein
MLQKWLATQMIGAVVLTLRIIVKYFSKYLYDKSLGWREKIRVKIWWPYKVSSLSTAEDCTDDQRADSIAMLFKFETPPEDSKWKLDDNKVYLPLPGSGYIRLPDGSYQKV